MVISDALVIKLLSNSKVSKDKVEWLKNHEYADKKALQYLAIKEGLINEKDLAKLYASEIDIPFIDLDESNLSPETLNLLPKRVAKKYRAVVFDLSENGSDKIAMEDPEDIKSVIYLRKLLGHQLKVYLATASQIDRAISKMKIPKDKLSKRIDEEDAVIEISSETLNQTISELIKKAIEIGASDIHIEPRDDFIVTRYRVDGGLKEFHKLPINMMHGLIDEIKLVGGLSRREFKLPQSGKFKFEDGDQKRTISVYTMPVVGGEKVVLKIINDTGELPNLTQLGLWGPNLKSLTKIISKPSGLVLVSGPVGSGRTTTLFSILNKLYLPTINIATIEDPIEHRINGINQSSINTDLGISFAKGLKAILEHDPDIILVGELRDLNTAELVLKAANKGHLVLSSMFTSSAAKTIKRLADMKVEPHQTAACLRGVVSQRLVKRLCPYCAEQVTPSKAYAKLIKDKFNLESNMKLVHELEKTAISEDVLGSKANSMGGGSFNINRVWQPKEDGCEECDFSGFKGRVGIFEVLVSNEAVTQAVASNKPASEIEKAAVSGGMIKMKIDGLVKALRGLTTIEEVIKATGDA